MQTRLLIIKLPLVLSCRGILFIHFSKVPVLGKYFNILKGIEC